MRGTTSALLLTLGVGLGVYASPHIPSLWQTATELARNETGVVRAAAPSGPAAVVEAPERRPDDTSTRVFSPQQPLFARIPTTPQSEPKANAVVAVDQVTGPFRATVATESDTRNPRPEETRRDLVRDLQRELRRVGCYEGEISGEWSADVRRAMKSFTDRVNARLPLDQPDYILLTLVRGHADAACGKGCPAGQAMDGGRCVPKGLVARAPSRATAVVADSAPVLKQAPQPAGRKHNGTAGAHAERATSSSSWTTTVATAPEPAAPLAGRMALGGGGLTTGSITRPDITGTDPYVRDQRRPADARVAAAAPSDASGPSLPPASTYQAELPISPAPTPRPIGVDDPRPQPRKGTASRDRYDPPPRYIPPSYYSAPKPKRSIANRQWARKVFDNNLSGR